MSETTTQTRSHNKMDDVLARFENTRALHGGVIADASKHVGMSEAALQRALYRAKKAGSDIHFTTSHKKAKFQADPAPVAPVVEEQAEPDEAPARPSVLYGTR